MSMPDNIFVDPDFGVFLSSRDDDCQCPECKKTEYIRRDLIPVWQPIETAPKDGTRVLLFVRYSNNVTSIDDSYWDNRGHWNNHRLSNVIAWMPLPNPPEEPK